MDLKGGKNPTSLFAEHKSYQILLFKGYLYFIPNTVTKKDRSD